MKLLTRVTAIVLAVVVVLGVSRRVGGPSTPTQPLIHVSGQSSVSGANASLPEAALPEQLRRLNRYERTDSGSNPRAAASKQEIVANYGQVPLSFEANRGQTNAQVRFVARSSGYSLFLTSNEAVLMLQDSSRLRGAPPTAAQSSKSKISSSGAVLRFKLTGANPSPQVAGVEELVGKSNYFVGNDRTRWRTNVPTYAKVKYQSVYPGIDLVYHSSQRQPEYDFVVAPGANPQAIRLSLRGAERMEIDAQGDLVLHTAAGEVREHKPVVYQAIAGGRQEIVGSYVLRGKSEVGFAVAPYDTSQPLVIDPVLSYSTFLGDGGSGYSIAVDSAGDAYVTGFTSSVTFPTTAGAFQTTYGGGGDAFVTKLNANGSALIYSTYLGGSGRDTSSGIAVDAAGNAYVTGDTISANFPTTTGAFQTALGDVVNGDAFVTKLNASGSALVYSTYLGGNSIDFSTGIAVDAAGNAYLTGSTTSSNFPVTAGAFQTTQGGANNDAFVTKLNTNGSALIYSTYLGGSDLDVGYGIAVDSAGNTYVTGIANSPNFPVTPGAFQATCCGAFATKLSADGATLGYSTYLGGAEDAGVAISVDAADNAYLTGSTASAHFPTTAGAFQTTYGGGVDAFVTKLNASGSALVYSTYLGGSDFEQGSSVAVDSAGNVYLTGQTLSNNFPTTPDAFQTTFGGGVQDAFVTELNGSGSALVSSSYLGGSLPDIGNSIAVDAAGNAYVAGYTQSTNFPTTPGAFQTTFGGNTANAFVTKVVARFAVFASALTPSTVSPGGSATSTIDLSAETGFTDSVALSCSVQPSPAQAPKCSFSPSSITPGTSAQLTVSTTGPSAGVLPSRPVAGPFYALWLPLLGLAAGVGLGSEQTKKGKIRAAIPVCLLFAGLVFAAACSSGGNNGGGGGTPAGTYTITVMGTSGSLAHSTNTVLTVQ